MLGLSVLKVATIGLVDDLAAGDDQAHERGTVAAASDVSVSVER
jgi:hypothetical protein